MSSRIVVKSLPKNADEKGLTKKFSELGTLTDVKLMRTKDGRSRQFAFVGFRDAATATKAVKHFNNTYFNTTKMSVSLAESMGSSAARPWSKYSEGSSAHTKRNWVKPTKTSKDNKAETETNVTAEGRSFS